MNRMVASRLFLDGTHREAVGAAVVAQRVDVRRVEAQVTAVARRARHGRPEVAGAADAVRRARRVVAIARSRKEDRTARSVVAPLARHLVTVCLDKIFFRVAFNLLEINSSRSTSSRFLLSRSHFLISSSCSTYSLYSIITSKGKNTRHDQR